MNVLKSMWYYLAILLLDFYLLPLLIKDTGTAMFLLLGVVPIICFLCSLFYGVKQGFHWQYAVITAILFLPAIFLFYNASAWIYAPCYGIVACIGNALGNLIGIGKNGGH